MLNTRRIYQNIVGLLRSNDLMHAPVVDRVNYLRALGYRIERVRHHGSKVGDIHKLKSGETRIAVDAPRGRYRTAWAIITSPLAKLKYIS